MKAGNIVIRVVETPVHQYRIKQGDICVVLDGFNFRVTPLTGIGAYSKNKTWTPHAVSDFEVIADSIDTLPSLYKLIFF